MIIQLPLKFSHTHLFIEMFFKTNPYGYPKVTLLLHALTFVYKQTIWYIKLKSETYPSFPV
jgi:hypothetical protein